MKCLFTSHEFKRIGRQAVGKTLERYVACTKCKMVLVIMGVHPSFKDTCKPSSKKVYFERKYFIRNHKKIIAK